MSAFLLLVLVIVLVSIIGKIYSLLSSSKDKKMSKTVDAFLSTVLCIGAGFINPTMFVWAAIFALFGLDRIYRQYQYKRVRDFVAKAYRTA